MIPLDKRLIFLKRKKKENDSKSLHIPLTKDKCWLVIEWYTKKKNGREYRFFRMRKRTRNKKGDDFKQLDYGKTNELFGCPICGIELDIHIFDLESSTPLLWCFRCPVCRIRTLPTQRIKPRNMELEDKIFPLRSEVTEIGIEIKNKGS